MTHTYTVKGITCEGCVAKVKSKLLMHPDVLAADVKLVGQKAVVTMQRHIGTAEFQKLLGTDTKYKISEDESSSHNDSVDSASPKPWLVTYKPLLIIAVFITGVSILTSGSSAVTGMNHFMAGFFLVFSFFKLLDIKGFASSYAMYDLLAKKMPVYGYIYPFLELGLGISFLTGFSTMTTYWATIGVMGFSSIGVITAVFSGQKIRCACLGAVFNLPMSSVTIIEDVLMTAMAAAMIIW